MKLTNKHYEAIHIIDKIQYAVIAVLITSTIMLFWKDHEVTKIRESKARCMLEKSKLKEELKYYKKLRPIRFKRNAKETS